MVLGQVEDSEDAAVGLQVAGINSDLDWRGRMVGRWRGFTDEFPLLPIKSLCYMTLRLVVNRSGRYFSRFQELKQQK